MAILRYFDPKPGDNVQMAGKQVFAVEFMNKTQSENEKNLHQPAFFSLWTVRFFM